MLKEKIELQIAKLLPIVEKLKKTTYSQEKIAILNKVGSVKEAIKSKQFSPIFSQSNHPYAEVVIKAIIAIDQAPIVFNLINAKEDKSERLSQLIHQLVEIEHFYEEIGGLVGYHLNFLTLLTTQDTPTPSQEIHYIPPEGPCISEDDLEIRYHIKTGISQLNHTALFLPIGGAGDRLNLLDEETQKPLPAAILPFLGRTLLEGLIRDLQAQEYLYFKLYHKHIHIPIALMTSLEKDNYKHIYEIVANHKWFDRPKESFHFFMQPLVPMITEEGNWSLSSYLKLSLKPGGHGVIWKLAENQGIFKALTSQGYHQALVRQINNPLAGTDIALLALLGMGCQKQKSFGFLSCERILHSAEGANVLIERKKENTYSYCISNVEYTDFDRKSIGEVPLYGGSPFSKYPSNTNILYISIQAIQKALEQCAIPGELINMKTTIPYIDSEGNRKEVKGGRLESTMQNIADYMDDQFPHNLQKETYSELLQTFVLFSERVKTISTTKKSYKSGEPSLSTPEQAYYDLMHNNLTLFKNQCHFTVPSPISFDTYMQQGPNCLILFHPALGPLYSIIAQKIQRGFLAEQSELQLEIAEVDIQDLYLDGSLCIESYNPLGTNKGQNLLDHSYSSCTLKNVKITNKGINRQATQHYWKNKIVHQELVKIVLHEGAEFYAENLEIKGSHIFEVPSHHKLTLITNSTGEWIDTHLEKIDFSSWHWQYHFDALQRIKLLKITT